MKWYHENQDPVDLQHGLLRHSPIDHLRIGYLTQQQTEQLNKQEELAKNIELEAGELSYLSNDYLLYHESQQVDRWEAKFSTFSNDLSNLSVDKPDQQVLVNNIKANQPASERNLR